MQSGAFLAGRLTGNSALTSAVLGGAGMAAGLGIFSAIKQAGMREQAEIGFTGLLGGKGKGEASSKDMMDRINKMAVKTPFQITDLRNLSREALGGGFGKEEVLPLISMLGDATQGRAPELKRMLTNMVEIRNTGRANLRDVRQFGRAGIPIYEALNKVLGTTGAELGDMISSRKIGLKEITAALKLLTGKGGKFHNLMLDQMDGIIGKTSNLADAFGILGEKMGEPLLDITKMAVDALSASMEDATPHFKNFTTGLSELGKGAAENDAFKWMAGITGGTILLRLAASNPWTAIAVALGLLVEDIGAARRGDKNSVTYGLWKELKNPTKLPKAGAMGFLTAMLVDMVKSKAMRANEPTLGEIRRANPTMGNPWISQGTMSSPEGWGDGTVNSSTIINITDAAHLDNVLESVVSKDIFTINSLRKRKFYKD
jgi:hypothetical protein